MSQDIELDHVTMRFGALTAVSDVHLTIPAGEFFSFLGPSGCGKTTILRMISGFMEPTEGVIRIGGKDMSGIGPNKRPTALIFQNLALFPLMTVAENIGFGLEVRGIASADRRRRVRQLLDLVALPDTADKKVTELSGGQRQRIAIARALAVEPAVLLLDEPLSALDLKLRQHMRSELREIQKRTGVTFIYITHDQGEALTMSDRIGVMSRGVLRQVGDGRSIYDDPASAFVASFVGETNRFTGRVIGGCRRQGRHRDAVRQDDRPQPARPARGRRGDPVRPAGTDAPRRWRRRTTTSSKALSAIRNSKAPSSTSSWSRCRAGRSWFRPPMPATATEWLAAGHGGAGQLPPRRRRRPSHMRKTCHERGAAPLRSRIDHGDRRIVRLLGRHADRAAPVADGGFFAAAQACRRAKLGGPEDVYTVKNYITLWNNTIHRSIFFQTIWASALVTAITFAVCYPVAYFMAQVARPQVAAAADPAAGDPVLDQRAAAHLRLVHHPGLQRPAQSGAGGLGLLDQPVRLLGSPAGVIVGMVYVYILFMVFPLYNAIESLDRNQIEAARDLGSGWLRIHRRIVIPHAKPGIAVGLHHDLHARGRNYAVPPCSAARQPLVHRDHLQLVLRGRKLEPGRGLRLHPADPVLSASSY